MTLNVLLSILFAYLFEQWGWMPHGGLALANTVATSIEMVGLLVLMRKQLKGLFNKADLSGIIKGLAASLVMGLALWGWSDLFKGTGAWILAGGGILLGFFVYLASALLLRTQDVRDSMKYIRDRLPSL
jgi:putative peptidoglycan lipid II flippase